ncbi:MAG: NAD-dependent epimerase/dehydratase family protein [Rhodospirillaceae bacterium]|nr:NAD-dependent epimerase/dehydratase family protein [Rhodospirillaceae bacterium]MDD9913736.1 NAD-dependent epimerase/dehydratase family protein [Rhodospirillaceae bacterium]MDD9930038.1 NAD-dependent epimerase/dehydratase family protein [Rhodospirillaceae bacterium]
MRKILVTGAQGQIGSELVPALRQRHGAEAVVATFHRKRPESDEGLVEHLDSTDTRQLGDLLDRHGIGTIYHLAAMLSATGEADPQAAWDVNMGSLYAVLEAARARDCALFFPSSIGAFGPGTPLDDTPQDTLQRPNTIYGVSKVSGELLCDYYAHRFGLDARGLRYPGLISYVTPPGGGTTDYAVEIFYHALRDGRYTCFLAADTRLDMMYMPDATRAAIALMEADPATLTHRNAFNVTAMNVTPAELADAIRVHIPNFTIAYDVDPVRQAIAESWPNSMDDSEARAQWGWAPKYDLAGMVADMLEKLGG